MADLVEVKPARQVRYSPELGEAICEAIATTARGIDYLCATRRGWPDPRTVARWLGDHAEFRKAYEIAKARQADFLFFECLEIADDASGDRKLVTRNDGSEVEVLDREFVERAKLRVSTRLTMAGKLAPKKYGDRLDVNATLGLYRVEDVLDQLR